MKRASILIFAAILAVYCYEGYKLYRTDRDDRLKVMTEGALSEITDRVASIPLETPDSGAVTNVKRVLKDGDDVFLISNNRILHYDISGKFINHIAENAGGDGEFIASYTLDAVRRQVIVIDSHRNILTCSYGGDFVSRKTLPHRWQRISAMEFYNGFLWATAETHVKMDGTDELYRVENRLYQMDYRLNILSSTVLKAVEVGRKQLLPAGNAVTELLAAGDGLYAYSSPDSMNTLLNDTLYILEQQKLPALHTGEMSGQACVYQVRRGNRFFISGNGFTFCYDGRNHTAYHLDKGFRDDLCGTGYVSGLRPVDIYGNTYCYMNTDGNTTSLYVFSLKA